MYCPLLLIGAEVKFRVLSDLISHPRPWQTQTIVGHRSVHGKMAKDWLEQTLAFRTFLVTRTGALL